MYFLGIDTSTTSSKALLIDERGDVIAVASSSHTLQTPRPLWSEQNPHEWWTAVSASIKSVLEKAGIGGERIAAVGLTGQMHGLVLLDEAGNVLRPAILWNDQRTQSQCDEIHQRMEKDKFIQITGNVALTGFTAPKILWVKENELDVFTQDSDLRSSTQVFVGALILKNSLWLLHSLSCWTKSSYPNKETSLPQSAGSRMRESSMDKNLRKKEVQR